MEVQAVDIIKAMITPGVMINACGLLLLGMNNKYSLIVNRIRTLNAEKRNKQSITDERITCINKQMPYLQKRLSLVRNAVWLYTVGISMFAITMLLIGLRFAYELNTFINITEITLFILGVVFVLVGSFFAANETRIGYRIIEIEINSNQ